MFAKTEKDGICMNAQFTNVEFDAALKNFLQHFIYISGLRLDRSYAWKLWLRSAMVLAFY